MPNNKPKTNRKVALDELSPIDNFQTPAYALDPLAPYIKACGYKVVWESAVGLGHLLRALQAYDFTTIATDLAASPYSSSFNYFDDTIFEVVPNYDIEVTNPPFSKKYPWIAKACERGKPFALLVPSDVLFAGRDFQPLMKRFNLQMLIPDKRIAFATPYNGFEGSSPQLHTSWVCYKLNLPERVNFCEIKPREEMPL